MPLGFGIAEKLRERGRFTASFHRDGASGRISALLLDRVLADIYLSARFRLGRRLTNSSGSCAGFLAYEMFGAWHCADFFGLGTAYSVISGGTPARDASRGWAPRWRLSAVYCGLSFGFSCADAKANAAERQLVAGIHGCCWVTMQAGRLGHHLEGQILQVQIWDRSYHR